MLRRQFIRSFSVLLAGYGLSSFAFGKKSPPTSIKPRHVICFLGEWQSLAVAEKIVAAFGQGFSIDREYSISQADDRMKSAFSASLDRVTPTFSAADWRRINQHNTVVYVLSPPIEKANALAISTAALQLTAKLIKAGATAVKSESAGIAHGLDHWLRLAKTNALREAWVRRPILDEDTHYSCGMHLLGLPDIECVGRFQALEAVRWIDAIADNTIAGKPIPSQFAINSQTPAKKIKHVACERYASDSFFFNPYGYLSIAA